MNFTGGFWPRQEEVEAMGATLTGRLDSRPTADGEAMAELWRQHGHALIKFARQLTLGDQQRAEDIVQESLLRAWRHPEVVGNGKVSIRHWLILVTRHIAIDMWRARSRSPERIEDEDLDQPDPVEWTDQAVTAIDLRVALGQLTADHRDVIIATYLRGWSVAEIAMTFGIPPGTVKSRTYYGLRQLRQILAGSEYENRRTSADPVLERVSA
jgi:RNA polymerase sigma-70 factor, ECF subfamily